MHLIRLAKHALRLSYAAPVGGALLRWYAVNRDRKSLTNSPDIKASWEKRQRIALECQELQCIPRHPAAGTTHNGILTMHNGVKVLSFSYYGEGMRLLIEAARGVHEPQEEYVFQEVLKFVPPGSTMLELGAYWGFYSIWLKSVVPDARCLLVEPSEANLDYGRANFRLNKMRGEFIQAYVGTAPPEGDPRLTIISVDRIVKEKRIDRLAILHADIQEAEYQMLEGARESFAKGIIDYCFISTHTDALHEKCLQWLLRQGHTILAEYDLKESYSDDGLIVAKRSSLDNPRSISVSKRSPSTSF